MRATTAEVTATTAGEVRATAAAKVATTTGMRTTAMLCEKGSRESRGRQN